MARTMAEQLGRMAEVAVHKLASEAGDSELRNLRVVIQQYRGHRFRAEASCKLVVHIEDGDANCDFVHDVL